MSDRRDFIATSTALFGGAWLTANMPMIETVSERARLAFASRAAFQTLTSSEAKTMAAFAEQILPSDDLPGAREAGAIYFIDAAVGGPMQGLLQPVRALAQTLDAKAKERSVSSFGDLPGEQQIEVMKSLEQTQLFFIGRMLSVIGTFSDPRWSGGRDHAGLTILGIDHQPAYQPPFGYYDAEALTELKARE